MNQKNNKFNKNGKTQKTGCWALATLIRFHQIAVSEHQISHQYGDNGFGDTEILRCAKEFGFRAKHVTPCLSCVLNKVLPAIAKDKNGEYFILARVQHSEDETGSKLLVHLAGDKSPKILSIEEFNDRWNGELIYVSRPDRDKTKHRSFNIHWFIPALIKYRKIFGEVLLSSFFLQIFALVTPLFFQVVMDKVLVHKGFTTLDVLSFGFLVVAVFNAVLSGLRNYIFSHTTNRVDAELGAKLYKHLIALPLSYFETRQVGQSVARVRELETIRNFITGSSLTLVIDLLFTIVFFCIMWFYSPVLTLVVLATLPCYISLSIVITPILRRRLNQKFSYGAANHSFLVESISGIQTVKASSLEPQMQQRWEEQLSKYVMSSFRVQNLNNVASQVAGFISKITTLLIIWWGAHLAIRGEISVGQLIAFNMFATRVSGPVLKLVQLWQDFQQAGISLKRLGDILNTPREPGTSTNRSTFGQVNGKVVFDDVGFSYRPNSPPVLEDLSFEVSPGEVVGIVGKSGSGKSTVTKLIQRLYVPQRGRVLVDDVDLALVDTGWLRRKLGVVLQESFLFNRTIRENIALSNPGTPFDHVVRAAKIAGAHEFILEQLNGYDTMIEENGCNLSGGQKQRIAIARALLNEPRILIFDEATSALDYESERIIQDNMAQICRDRTVFVIAHRLSTVKECHRIVVMDRGKIVEQGTHAELLAIGGCYASLYKYQNNDKNDLAQRIKIEGKPFARIVRQKT